MTDLTSHMVSVVYHSYGAMVEMCIATVGVAFEPLSTRSRTRGRMQEGHCLCARRSVNTFGLKWC